MKINVIFLTVTALALAAGCTSDFLTVDNPTAEPIDEYFTTEAHLNEALVAAYDPLEWPDWCEGQYNPVCVMSDIMADQIWVGGSDKTDNQFWHFMMNFEATPNVCMSGLWADAYSGVKRCNDVLLYIGWTRNLDSQEARRVEAEARVLRVFYYNWLWKFWGNIPYYEENLSQPFVCEQISADQVYANMIADLEGAIALDALKMKETGDRIGHVTKAMAYMLYAEIVLYQNDESRLPKALDYMKEIIGSGAYSLTPDFADIWEESGEWSDESIFEINYKDDNGLRSYDWVRGTGGTILPRLISPNGWTGDNIHDNGWGFAPVRLETVQLYDAADARLGATCWNAAAAGSYNARYQDTGYFLGKYIALKENNKDRTGADDLNFNNNLRIYRYAETLLNAAELVARGFGSGDAQAWLDAVHGRSLSGATVGISLENIKAERRLEFVGEGKRYWDLVRWGDASTVLVPDAYGYRTNAWSTGKKYLPIPQSEIDAAAGTPYPLTQNNYQQP